MHESKEICHLFRINEKKEHHDDETTPKNTIIPAEKITEHSSFRFGEKSISVIKSNLQFWLQ